MAAPVRDRVLARLPAVSSGALPSVYLLILAAAMLALVFIAKFVIDVPVWDEWELVPLLDGFYSGRLTFTQLIAQHNEHRILFPRLVMLALEVPSRMDVTLPVFAGWAIMMVPFGLLLQEHRRTFGASPGSLAYFVPAAWLFWSLRQNENFLGCWQIAFLLCGAGFVSAAVLVQNSGGFAGRFSFAVIAATIATFSLASGMAAWPAVLVQLLLLRACASGDERRRYGRCSCVWSIAGLLNIALYLHDYHAIGSHPDPLAAFRTPDRVLGFAASLWGASLARNLVGQAILGVCVIVGIAAVAWAAVRRRVDLPAAVLAVPLVLFAGLNVLALTMGRSGLGPNWALASRYCTLTLLGVLGFYRGALCVTEKVTRTALLSGAAILFAFGIKSSLWDSFAEGKAHRDARLELRAILQRGGPDEELTRLYPSAPKIHQFIANLKKYRLNAFR